MKSILFPVLACILIGNCKSSKTLPVDAPFVSSPASAKVNPGIMDEASGIADSKSHPGWLWVEQDSGNPTDLYLLSHSGSNFKKVHLKGILNRDWEDIAIGKGPQTGKNYLYLADIGDNYSQYGKSYIYRFPEPVKGTDTVFAFDKITFRYPDGAHDAEAILIDGLTKDIYIITKRDTKSALYKLAYPQNDTGTITAYAAGELSFNGVVSASLSSDSREVLLKTYKSIYYWKRKPGEAIEATLRKPAANLPYQQEQQGEAICFKKDDSGFFTLGERPVLVSFVNLNFYKRK